MKKRLQIISALLILAWTSAGANAAVPVGQPITIAAERTIAAVDVSSMTNRELEQGHIGAFECESFMVMARLQHDFSDRLSLRLRMGVADLELAGGTDFDNGFAWGLGATYVVWEEQSHPIDVAVSVDYIDGNPERVNVTGGYLDPDFDLIQATLHASRSFGNFTPYGGLRYTELRTTFTGPGTYKGITGGFKAHARDNWGAFVGLDYSITDRADLGFEFHFPDEVGFSGSFAYTLPF